METADVLNRVQNEAFPLQMQEHLRPIINMRRVVDRPDICNALTTTEAVDKLKQDAELGKDTALVVWAESRDDGAEGNRLNPWRVNTHTQIFAVAGDIFWPPQDSLKRDSNFYNYVRDWCHANFGNPLEYVSFVHAMAQYRSSFEQKKRSLGKKLVTKEEVLGSLALAEMAVMVMDDYRAGDTRFGESHKDRFQELWTQFNGHLLPGEDRKTIDSAVRDLAVSERSKGSPLWFWENVYPKDGASQ